MKQRGTWEQRILVLVTFVLLVITLATFTIAQAPPVIEEDSLENQVVDNDGDGFCGSGTLVAFQENDPWPSRAGCPNGIYDCDDNDANRGAKREVCNGYDDNCNGQVDENPYICSQEMGPWTSLTINNPAIPRCVQGACECRPGRGDCDNDRTNGCEARIDVPTSCGACGRDCSALGNNAVWGCAVSGGQYGCVLSGCRAGFANANGNDDDGCETRCSLSNNGVEMCDNLDNDCDGDIDEGCDDDGDGYCDFTMGLAQNGARVCPKSTPRQGITFSAQVGGSQLMGDDCLDEASYGGIANPGVQENNPLLCTDELDNDCDRFLDPTNPQSGVDEDDHQCQYMFVCREQRFDAAGPGCSGGGAWCVASYAQGTPSCAYDITQNDITTGANDHNYFVYTCTKIGTSEQTCSFYHNGTFQVYESNQCTPAAEVCGNNQDDDCDGVVDEPRPFGPTITPGDLRGTCTDECNQRRVPAADCPVPNNPATRFPAHCSNSQLDSASGETDVDCGGPCAPCATGGSCTLDSDCGRGDTCIPTLRGSAPSAGASTGLGLSVVTTPSLPGLTVTTAGICGGFCTSNCADGERCRPGDHGACQSGVCGSDGTCAAPTCSDGVRNGGESGVDCGSVCAAQGGNLCRPGTPIVIGPLIPLPCEECAGGECSPGIGGFICGPPGTACSRDCPTGETCTAHWQCADRYCDFRNPFDTNRQCLLPSDDNGVADDDETDIDCGGPNTERVCRDGQHCNDGGDCGSGICIGGFCGGTGCVESSSRRTCLPIGASCESSADCGTGVCDRGTCTDPTCFDGVFNGREGDRDCGFVCSTTGGSLCIRGQRCNVDEDCGGESCINGYCGGVCTENCPPNWQCNENADCAFGVCLRNQCQRAACDDTIQNGFETDVDCGGASQGSTCAGCGINQACTLTTDCGLSPTGSQLICSGNTCQDICVGPACTPIVPTLPRCDDGTLNGGETGVDCGGDTCAGTFGFRCADGSGCDENRDCASGICRNGFCGTNGACTGTCGRPGATCVTDAQCADRNCVAGACVAATCSDNRTNGGETGVDCGGPCTGCNETNRCNDNGDCEAPLTCNAGYCGDCGDMCSPGEECNGNDPCVFGPCANGVCPNASCTDGIQNNGETGIDCGGSSTCARCGANETGNCQTNADCVPGLDCVNFDCMVPVIPCSPTCAEGSVCIEDRDCASNDCDAGRCVAAPGGNCTTNCGNGQPCSNREMCASGNCANGRCAPAANNNGIQDGNETGPDCGGPNTFACPDGENCQRNADCTSGICINGFCGTAGCTGTGCGNVNDPCVGPENCTSAVCSGGTCAAGTCNDGIFNNGEADIDCGAVCGARNLCDNSSRCVIDGDCTEANCLDPFNSGVSYCGGNCTADCPTSYPCLTGAGCASGVCTNNTCAAATCADGVRNGAETDVDCGGNCIPCFQGSRCRETGDCVNNDCCLDDTCGSRLRCGGVCTGNCQTGDVCYTDALCASGVCGADNRCVADPCSNGVQDGTEAGVDCGGNCPTACAFGQGCTTSMDCATGTCTNGFCGGVCTANCTTGAPCDRNGACESGNCDNNQCVTPTTDDGIRDGGETGVDCGGTSGIACPLGETCREGTDCVGGDCTSGFCGGFCLRNCDAGDPCTNNSACGSRSCDQGTCAAPTCSDTFQNGDETDVDCGGSCSDTCAAGQGCDSAFDCAPGTPCIRGFCGEIGCRGSCRADGEPCTENNDCESKQCGANETGEQVCQASSCNDNILNGLESDVDCGASCNNKCLNGAVCYTADDCADAVECVQPPGDPFGRCGGIVRPGQTGEAPQELGSQDEDDRFARTSGRGQAGATADELGAGTQNEQQDPMEEKGSVWTWLLVALLVLGILGGSSYVGYGYYNKGKQSQNSPTSRGPLPANRGQPLQGAIARHRTESAARQRKKFDFDAPRRVVAPVPPKPQPPARQSRKKVKEEEDLKDMLAGTTKKPEGKKLKKKDSDYIDIEELQKEKRKERRRKKKDDSFKKLEKMTKKSKPKKGGAKRAKRK